MDKHILILIILGISMLGMAWMPLLTKRIRMSYSILYLLFGMLLFSTMQLLPSPNPFLHLDFTVHITELVVIISLMASGLKIDEPFSFKTWTVPFRLVSVTMLLSIGIVAALGHYWLGLDLASSVLLGAVLAPTDPVLAGDVQVGPPLEKTKSEVRFTLTAEAGLNDGMAFPFTWLAITLALYPGNSEALWDWVWFDLLYRIVCGFIVGFILGKVISYFVFALPEKKNFKITRGGFIAISSTLLVYGLTELISGYGFVAVFVCAVTLRNSELEHAFHLELHSFTDQVERMLMAMVLVLFGGALIMHVIPDISWSSILFASVFLFVVRPVIAYPSFLKTDLHIKERMAIGFYGIRGIGSFFYLSFALQQALFENPGKLWDIVSVVVFISVFIHGLSANTVMARIEKQFEKQRKPGH